MSCWRGMKFEEMRVSKICNKRDIKTKIYILIIMYEKVKENSLALSLGNLHDKEIKIPFPSYVNPDLGFDCN